MAVKRKFLAGTKGKAQILAGAEVKPSIPVAAALYQLKAAVPGRVSKPVAKTIEHRLDDKAVAADKTGFTTLSLGQMSREARRKLLFG